MQSRVKQFVMLLLIITALPLLIQGCNSKTYTHPSSTVKSGIQKALATNDYSELIDELYTYCNPKEVAKSTTCGRFITNIYKEHINASIDINTFYRAMQNDTNLLYSMIESLIISNSIDSYNQVSTDIKSNISNIRLIKVINLYDNMVKYCSPRFSEAIKDYTINGCLKKDYFRYSMSADCYNTLVTRVIENPFFCAN